MPAAKTIVLKATRQTHSINFYQDVEPVLVFCLLFLLFQALIFNKNHGIGPSNMEKPMHCCSSEIHSRRKNLLDKLFNCLCQMVMVPAVITGVVGCKISCLTFFFSLPAIKDSNSTVPFLSCLFFLGRTGKNMNSLSPFYILCFFSLQYCIAFIRIISFSLNLKSLIITAQQDSSTNGPGTSDLYALSISKVSISSQYKMAFNFSFFLFLIQ